MIYDAVIKSRSAFLMIRNARHEFFPHESFFDARRQRRFVANIFYGQMERRDEREYVFKVRKKAANTRKVFSSDSVMRLAQVALVIHRAAPCQASAWMMLWKYNNGASCLHLFTLKSKDASSSTIVLCSIRAQPFVCA